MRGNEGRNKVCQAREYPVTETLRITLNFQKLQIKRTL